MTVSLADPVSASTDLQPWLRDHDFLDRWSEVSLRTELPPEALFVLHRLVRQTSQLGGDVAELGVGDGGNAWVMAHAREREVPLHLFDTFADVETERALRREFAGLPDVHLHRGCFPATAFPLLRRHFSFVHCAAATRAGTLDCLHAFHCRLQRGGALLIEGYGAVAGVAEAVDEYYRSQAEVPVLLPTGQALVLHF